MDLIKHLPEKALLPNLIAAIQNDGNLDLIKVNRLELATELRKFKTEKGGINYPVLFKIPKKERIFEMSKIDLTGTIQIISVGISLALENINLKRPMTSSQVLDLAEAIIDESDSDNLALEDLLLFLQKLTRGEYGEMYESLDVPKFMMKFGQYRDERWDAGIKIRDEKDLELKNLGQTDRTSEKNTALDEHLAQFTTKLSAMKDEIKLIRAENKRLRDQNNF